MFDHRNYCWWSVLGAAEPHTSNLLMPENLVMISAYVSYRKKEGIQTQYGREGSPILKRCVSFWCKIDHFKGNQHSLLSKNLDFSFLCSTYDKIFGNKFLKLCFCLIKL